jgi:hypothetical protein
MKSTSPRRYAVLGALLLASTLPIAATEAWGTPIGDVLSLTDDPGSPSYLGETAPPSWQGRPYAIRGVDGLR